MELEAIFERLREATQTSSNSAMGISLGFGRSAASTWKRTGGIPYPACFRADQNTGYTMRWLITGEGPKRYSDPSPAIVDEETVVTAFKATLMDALHDEVVDAGSRWSKLTLDNMCSDFYTRLTGFLSIPKTSKSEIKQA